MDEFVFNPDFWNTPNTYDTNFSVVPTSCGVYVLINVVFDFENKKANYNILYVGSSKDLALRYKSHEVLRLLKYEYDYIRFYFKEFNDYLLEEKKMIKAIQPKYNNQWR